MDDDRTHLPFSSEGTGGSRDDGSQNVDELVASDSVAEEELRLSSASTTNGDSEPTQTTGDTQEGIPVSIGGGGDGKLQDLTNASTEEILDVHIGAHSAEG